METFLEKLWLNYIKTNKGVLDIYNLIKEHEQDNLKNDHIAFRLIKQSKLNIKNITPELEKLGYIRKDTYIFGIKKLDAVHFEHIDSKYPKLFLSEIDLNKLSKKTNTLIFDMIEKLNDFDINKYSLLAGRTWNINYKIYQELYKESEYLAWIYAFGIIPNHFTVSVNDLKKLNTINKINNFLLQNNIVLNKSGGLIKGTKKEGLMQSSTMAFEVDVEFKEGIYKIPCSYYEFAKRFKIDGVLFEKFISKSADRIFESTNQKIN